MTQPFVVGWDIGGAHLKTCLWQDGRVLDAQQIACPLWQGLDKLDLSIDQLAALGPSWQAALAGGEHRHAVTMSGEMVDHFADRAMGVAAIVRHLANRLGCSRLAFYAGELGWLGVADAAGAWRLIASANWRAAASHAAALLGDGLWLDIGSTTTDIIVLQGGRVASASLSDADRLASGELVYQGVVRTPLCALAERIDFDGRGFNVMHEWFAATADVYRLTGELEAAHDLQPSADGGPKDDPGSARRLARMIGHDAAASELQRWRDFALAWRRCQLDRIGNSLARVLHTWPLPDGAPFIAAGCGRFLVDVLAREARRPCTAYGDALAPNDAALAASIDLCAPSVAVAALWAASRGTPAQSRPPGPTSPGG